MAYYDKATSDELKSKFKDLAIPTGADFSGIIDYFNKGLQGMDDTGIQGPKGDKGDIGPQGPQGEPGAKGDTGDSAYEVAVNSGYNGTQEAWLASLKGLAGQSVWYYPYDRGANKAISWWSDLKPTPTIANPPKVGDTIIDLVGNVYQITNVVVSPTEEGGGTFDYGPLLTSMATGKEFNDLKNNLQNLVLSDRHRLTYKSASVSLSPHAGFRQPTADFEFKHLANMGLSATFVVMLNVADKNDPNVQMPDDTIITKAISEATAAGVSVTMIKPHIGVSFMDWLDRATYEPSDWAAFWTNWQNIMLHYAGICDANGIPILCLGCEQYKCTDASMIEQWGTLTAAIRSQYPNLKLTYAALGDEYFDEKHGQIAQYLDFMGANFYPSYTYKMVQPGNAGGITIDELSRFFYTGHRGYHEMVDFYKKKYNVPTFVTEIGVMPTDDGLAHLVTDNNFPQASDPTQQTGRFETPALAMEAFFNGLAQNPNIIGFAWWSVGYPFHFFNALGDSVAEDVMQKYVKGGLI